MIFFFHDSKQHDTIFTYSLNLILSIFTNSYSKHSSLFTYTANIIFSKNKYPSPFISKHFKSDCKPYKILQCSSSSSEVVTTH